MAHTERKRNDKRRFTVEYPSGTRVAIPTSKGIAFGFVTRVDGGNWIYPAWDTVPPGAETLPGYVRPNQVILDTTNQWKNPPWATEDVEATKKIVQTHHDTLGYAMRGGAMSYSQLAYPFDGSCFNGLNNLLNNKQVYVVFHGDGCVMSFNDLVDTDRMNQRKLEYTRPWNKFEGTERSRLWVQYLLHGNSPWKALVPFLFINDMNWINNAGFVFETRGLPRKLWYNFLMAIRYPWEQPEGYSLFLLLVEKMEANLACFIANSFFLSPGAKSLEEGPWQIKYPMSFLESMTLEAAGRFILSQPGELTSIPGTACSPNCAPLWETKNVEARKAAIVLADAMAGNDKLTLEDIMTGVNKCVEEQRKHF